MKKNLFTILILTATLSLGLFGCGDSPLTEAYNYIPNRAPVIESLVITDYLGNDLIANPADYLASNNEITIAMTAYDPEGKPLNVKITSDFGGISNESTIDGTTTATLTTNSNVTPDMPVSIIIELTDSAGMLTSRVQVLGTGNSGLQITETSASSQSPYTHSYNFATPVAADERTFEFTSLIPGIYQIRTDEPVFNRQEAVYLYYPELGDTISISVNDAENPLGSEGAHDFYIIFRDTIGNEAAFTKTVIADDTPSGGTISFSTSKTSRSAVTPVISADDNLTPEEDMEVQISESSTFSGAEWVKVIPEDGTSNSVSISAPDEDKTFYVRFRDGAGNINTTFVDSATITRDTLAPGDVTGFTAEGLYGKVKLSWTNPITSDLSGVIVIRSTGTTPPTIKDGDIIYNSDSPTPGDSVSYTDVSKITNGVTYYYRVYTLDDLNNYSELTTVADSAVPQNNAPTAPANLANYSDTDDEIYLKWDGSTDPDGHSVTYIISISPDDTKYDILVKEISDTNYSINPEDIRDEYGSSGTCYFRIRAVDSLQEQSSSSNAIAATVSKFSPAGVYSTQSPAIDVKVNFDTVTVTGFGKFYSIEIIDISKPDNIQQINYSQEKFGVSTCETDSYIFMTRLSDTTTSPTGYAQISVYNNKFSATVIESLEGSPATLGTSDKNIAWSSVAIASNQILVAALDGVYGVTYDIKDNTLTVQNPLSANINAYKIALYVEDKTNYVVLACQGEYNSNTLKYENDGLLVYTYNDDTSTMNLSGQYRGSKEFGDSEGCSMDSFVRDNNGIFYCALRNSSISSTQYLYIVDVPLDDPTESSLQGKVEVTGSTSSSPLDLCKLDKYIFMAAGTDGIRIFDVSDTSTPVLKYTMPNINALRVAVDEKYLYVAAGTGGFRLYSTSDIFKFLNE